MRTVCALKNVDDQTIRRVFWVAFAVVVAAYYPRFANNPAGLSLYLEAAKCLLRDEVLQQCQPLFTYPPAFAFFMIPLAPLPMWLRNIVWYAITIGGSVACYRMCEALARRFVSGEWTDRQIIWLRGLSLVLCLKFLLAVLENQAYDTFAFLFLLAGLVSLASGRDVFAGCGLGLAAAIKATPLIFLPYLLFKRRFAAAAAFVAAFMAVSLLPDLFFTPAGGTAGYFLTWVREVAGAGLGNDPATAKHAFWVGPNLLNHSLRGAVSHIVSDVAEPRLHATILYIAYGAFIALAALLLACSPRRRELTALDGSVLVIGMLMLSPMTSRSHYVVLLLPYTTLAAAWLHDRSKRGLGGAVLLASFVLATATSNDLVGTAVSEWAYGHGLLVLGALVLLIYVASLVRQAGQRDEGITGPRPNRQRLGGVLYRLATFVAAALAVTALALFFEPILHKRIVVTIATCGALLTWSLGAACLYLLAGRRPSWRLHARGSNSEVGTYQSRA